MILILVQAGEFGENESFIAYDLYVGTTLEQANELGTKLNLIGMWVGDQLDLCINNYISQQFVGLGFFQ